MSTFRKIILIIFSFFIAFLAVVAFALAKAKITGKAAYIGNYTMFTITSTSMNPTLVAGQIVIIKKCDSYNLDDIITFKNGETGGTTTHRIVKVYGNSYETKGDSNNYTDSTLATNENILGKVVLASLPLKGVFEFIYEYKIAIVIILGLVMVGLITLKGSNK